MDHDKAIKYLKQFCEQFVKLDLALSSTVKRRWEVETAFGKRGMSNYNKLSDLVDEIERETDYKVYK